MKTITFYVLSVSQTCGADLKKITLTSEDEEYDVAEFKDFDDYVTYVREEEVAECEQQFASAIILNDGELDYVMEKIVELKA